LLKKTTCSIVSLDIIMQIPGKVKDYFFEYPAESGRYYWMER